MRSLRQLISLPARQWEARARRLRFETICRATGLQLSFHKNKSGISVLEEVFVNRMYSNYFPFYSQVQILDVGGHYGYFAMFAARNSASGSRIVTVEPSVRNLAVLRANLAATQLMDVQVMAGAVAATNGTASLHIANAENCTLIAAHAEEFPGSGLAQTEEVTTFTLSEVLARAGLEEVDVLKLDCEGAEYDIVFSTPAHELQRARVIMMEFHDLRDARRNGGTMMGDLVAKGFRIVEFEHLPTNKNLNYGKIVAIRK